MKINVLFVFYILLLSSLSYSQISSHGNVNSLAASCEKIDGTQFELKDGVTCTVVDRFLGVLKSIQLISPITLRIPKVTFSQSGPFQSVSAENTMELSEKNTNSESLYQENMIWYHELGHVIFNDLSIAYVPSPLKYTDSKIGAYSELFADFIALILTENLDSTWASFSNKIINTQDDMQFKKLSFLKENQDGTCNDGAHLYFSFARPAIADHYFKQGMTSEQKKEAILDFFKFIYSEAQSNELSSGSVLDCSVVNNKLIKNLSLLE